MKRLGNLYDKIISLDNLRLADERARKGKLRSYGVKLHDRNKEANLLSLHEALRQELIGLRNIVPSQYTSLKNAKFSVCHTFPIGLYITP